MTNEEALAAVMEKMGQEFAGDMARKTAGQPKELVAAYGLAIAGACVAVMVAAGLDVANLRAALNSICDDMEAEDAAGAGPASP